MTAMVKALKANLREKPSYRETAREYRWLVRFVALCLFFFMLALLIFANTGQVEIEFVVLPIVMTAFFYFAVNPVSVEVRKDRLILRLGIFWVPRNRSISLNSIRAIRRVRYDEGLHTGVTVGGTKLERWNLNAKQVIAIELENGDRIHITAPNIDRLTSLLHEMTRVSVEDFR